LRNSVAHCCRLRRVSARRPLRSRPEGSDGQRSEMARDNGLPPKESALFKSIVKHYETKQYKKGMKVADMVLKKFPDHGETLAMKGLIMNCLERKTEAYDLVRRGIKQDMMSHVCWHVFGLLYRSDRNYLQAIKSYRNALRQDPDNIQILRDLSLLQIQMRDLAGFVTTRRHLLTLKPTNRNNWFTFAVSQHLMDRQEQAVGIVKAYEDTLEGTPENDYEHGEMLLYKNMLMEEGGQTQEALDHLEQCKEHIVDGLFLNEKRAGLLRQLGRHEEAEPIYRQLLRRNPEHYGYHAGLQACILRSSEVVEHWLHREVDEATETTLKRLYEELQHQHPKSSVCRRLPLDFARDTTHFRVAAKTYMLPPLRKGVPSLFADLKPLYAHPDKAKALGDIFSDWLETLLASGCLRGEKEPEMPTTLLWVRVLIAQHCDMVGDMAAALEHMDAAIEHSPTLQDLYMLKSRIYKHAGALVDAADWMDRARLMDLSDRYLNTKSTRYMLRADQVEQAQKTIALFTKDGDQVSNLFDMQCMWYELEIAASYRRQGDFGRALKNYISVDKHFTDIIEDQFDFHTYCVRKMTLRAYIRMLRMEDTIYGHSFFVSAAVGLVETYIALVDKPAKAAAEESAEELSEMSAAERKKLESKRRKAEAKAKAEQEAKAKEATPAAAAAAGGKGKGAKNAKEKPVDEDPDGAALASVEDPLERASAFLRTLQAHASQQLRTHTLACELAMRKKRYLLVLRALRKATAIAPDDPSVHVAMVRFLLAVEGSSALPPTISKVIESQRDAIGAPVGKSLQTLNEEFLLRAPASPAAILAAAEMGLAINPAQRDAALAHVTALDPAKLPLPVAIQTHQLLKGPFADAAAAAAFRERAVVAYPLADCFKK